MSDLEHFVSLRSFPPYELLKGATARGLHGRDLTLTVTELAPGLEIEEHHHAPEQLGFVLRGSMKMKIAGETRDLAPGDAYWVPADTAHWSLAGSQGATLVEAFHPPRADWESKPRTEPEPLYWKRISG